MWRWEDEQMCRWEDVKMWRWEDVKMWGCEDVRMWGCEGEKIYEDVRMWKWEDVKMWGCEDEQMWRFEDVLWRCEAVKMFDRPPLLEEPFAQTLSGIKQKTTKNKLIQIDTIWCYCSDCQVTIDVWKKNDRTIRKVNVRFNTRESRHMFAVKSWTRYRNDPNKFIYSDNFFGDFWTKESDQYAVVNGLFAEWPVSVWTEERFGPNSELANRTGSMCIRSGFFPGTVATKDDCGDDYTPTRWFRDHVECSQYVARQPNDPNGPQAYFRLGGHYGIVYSKEEFEACSTYPENVRTWMQWNTCQDPGLFLLWCASWYFTPWPSQGSVARGSCPCDEGKDQRSHQGSWRSPRGWHIPAFARWRWCESDSGATLGFGQCHGGISVTFVDKPWSWCRQPGTFGERQPSLWWPHGVWLLHKAEFTAQLSKDAACSSSFQSWTGFSWCYDFCQWLWFVHPTCRWRSQQHALHVVEPFEESQPGR